MPKGETFFEKMSRQRKGEFEIGDSVAQDYKRDFNFHKQMYIPDQKAEELIGVETMDKLRMASKIINIIFVDATMMVGVMFRSSNPNNDPDHTDWSIWIRNLVVDGPEPGDDAPPPWYEEQAAQEAFDDECDPDFGNDLANEENG